MTAVAEGIESSLDLEFALRAGFDEAQGYAISHPISPQLFLGWKSEWDRQI
jgi:EAL domain-containing protein (putative c-di-GMP-specific phosphodiesterase class I)